VEAEVAAGNTTVPEAFKFTGDVILLIPLK
jgi:hypothetical protein